MPRRFSEEHALTPLIIGGNGQIARHLARLLAIAGAAPRAMIRSPDQADELAALGAEPVQGDLEGDFERALDGCDAVIFSAGSGGHTGGDKTLLVDLWGALRSIRVCEEKGIRRYLMVSALRAQDPDRGPDGIRHYLVAKHIADDYLTRSDLDYTIVRPGRLTDAPGTGRVHVASLLSGEVGEIPREDVAAVLAECLASPGTVGKTFDLVSGDTPIRDAIQGV